MEEKQAKIKELLEKGVENIYPTKKFLEDKLNSGEKLTIYLGIDPTGPELHIGHSIPLMKLRAFQDLGHKIILLIGNFTAICGDPDKSHTRKRLTAKEINANLKNYKKQIGLILNLKGKNKAEFKFNHDWLSKLNFSDLIEIASHFTVQQMLVRDLFDRRIKAESPIALHEFFYPLMQAYDSVHMNVDGELGGNDQTFNMLAGRQLMKAIKNKEKFVLTTKLLADPTGKKMGKTEGNMIILNDTPKDMFGKIMSWSDEMIPLGFELCTKVPLAEIKKMEADLKSGANPRDLKSKLAKAIISLYYDDKQADSAEAEFNNIFRDKGKPEDMPEFKLDSPTQNIIDILVNSNLVPSKNEARRMVEQKAVKLNDEVIEHWDKSITISTDSTLQVGKRKFVKLVLK